MPLVVPAAEEGEEKLKAGDAAALTFTHPKSMVTICSSGRRGGQLVDGSDFNWVGTMATSEVKFLS